MIAGTTRLVVAEEESGSSPTYQLTVVLATATLLHAYNRIDIDTYNVFLA